MSCGNKIVSKLFQLDSWLTHSKSVFTVSSASIFGAGACNYYNGLYPGEFYNNRGKT